MFEREGWKRGGWSERRRGRNLTTCYFFGIDVIPPLYRFSWMTCGPYSRPLFSISVGTLSWFLVHFFHDLFFSISNSGCYTNLIDVGGVIIQVVHDGVLISLMPHQVSLF